MKLKKIQCMKKSMMILLMGWLVVSTIAAYGETPSYQPKYHTIAHEILRVESEMNGTTPNYELLDAIIDNVKQGITVQPSYSKDEALTILQRIARVLYEQNFREGDTMLLTETYTSQTINEEDVFVADCDTFSFLYLGIGEAFGFPLRLVSLPQHTFIRWHFSNDTYLNWETTKPVSWTDLAYISWYNARHTPKISPEQELRSLQRTEIFAIVYYNLGNVLTKRGDYDQAIAKYTEALSINPNLANALYQRGYAWYMQGDDDNAIADFSRALELNPHDADALYFRGNAWYMQGNYESAIADFSAGLDLDPNNAEAYYLRGSAWYMKRNYDKALADFSHALEIDAQLAEVYNDMAWMFATCPDERYRDGEKAILLAQKALELEPELRRYYLDTLAAAYAETGNFQEAITAQEEAIALIQAKVSVEGLGKYMQRLEQYKMQKPWRE